jgi:four helix bundle protein
MFTKARELTREVYKALATCKDHGFRDQIQRAAVSVLSNIAEGFESGTRTEFLHYLFIAKASAGEVRAQTYVGYDVGYLNMETFKYLNGLAEECSRLIYSFTQRTKQGAESGLQYKLPDSKMEEIMETALKKADLVMTKEGLKTKEEAASKNLEILGDM